MSGALLVIGLVVVGAVLLRQQPAPPQAPVADGTASSGAPVSDGGGAPTGRSDDGGAETAVEESTADPTEETVAPLAASEPTRIRVPALAIDAPVFPIALGADGTLPAPSGERADDAAWFDGSPTPGEDGPSVIEGHVTYSEQPSVFFELGDVQAGDRIEVDREDGSTAAFEVTDVRRVPKDEFPTWAVYGNTDGPELRLITCGGEVDETGRHQDNVLVYARLVEG